MDGITRRKFLATSTALMAGARLLVAEEKPALPGLLVGIRDQHLRETGLKDSWSSLQAIGAEAVEVLVAEDLTCPALFNPEKKYGIQDAAGIAALLADAKAANIKIAALCMMNRFDERLEQELDWVKKTAAAAKALGVGAIRIDVVPRKMTREAFPSFAIDAMKKAMEVTADTDVSLAIENHGDMTNDPEFLQKLFEGVGAPGEKRLGLTLDTGNFYWYGHPLSKLYDLFETFATRVRHTHVKAIKYPEASRDKRRAVGWEYGKYVCPLYEGDVDYRRVVGILRKAGYRNDLCIENEALSKFPAEERKNVLAREVKFLKDLL
jgi:sugar phosphate isomerase/epimerase